MSLLIPITTGDSEMMFGFWAKLMNIAMNTRNDYGSAGTQPLFTKPGKRILILGLIAFCCMLCEGAMADWRAVYFQKVVQSGSFATIGYVAFTLAMAAGRFLGDWLVTKHGVKRMLQISGVLISAGLLIAVIFPIW